MPGLFQFHPQHFERHLFISMVLRHGNQRVIAAEKYSSRMFCVDAINSAALVKSRRPAPTR